MKTVILIFWVFFLSFASVRADEVYGNFHNVTYLSMVSAMSFMADIPGQHPIVGRKIEVLVKGIEVPDQNGVCKKERERAGQAVKMVEFMLSRARDITLKNVERDRRFRLAATVLVDGKDIREVLLKKEFAVKAGDRSRPVDWCR